MKHTISSTVYLVGFGPGDPELITLKAHRLIKSAHIIFYDDLINQTFLNEEKSNSCKTVYVGKRKGKHSKTQSEINVLLYQATQKYQTIVRLKGGDPFIFGRGGEELLYLREKKILVEVVPGITASLAASASFQIPLTMRGTAKYLTFMAAHHLEINNFNLYNMETIVLYMVASKITILKDKLLKQNYPLQTPIAILQNVSYSYEKKIITTLEYLKEDNIESPVVIIIGDVVQQFNID